MISPIDLRILASAGATYHSYNSTAPRGVFPTQGRTSATPSAKCRLPIVQICIFLEEFDPLRQFQLAGGGGASVLPRSYFLVSKPFPFIQASSRSFQVDKIGSRGARPTPWGPLS